MLQQVEKRYRGKSANQIKNMLITESMQKQKITAEKDANFRNMLAQKVDWVRAKSEVRELAELDEFTNYSNESSFKMNIKRSALNVSMGNLQEDLKTFTYNTEEVIKDAR